MFRRVLTMTAIVGLLFAGSVLAADPAELDTGLIPRPSAARVRSTQANSNTAGQKSDKSSRDSKHNQKPAAGGWLTTLGGLTAVLALIFLTAKVLRKSVPTAQKTLPPEAVEVLGRKLLDYRHTIHLIRFGSRLLMVGTSSEGMSTLAEITDPVEIDYLAGMCQPSEPATVAQNFSQLFRRFQASTGEDQEAERDEEHDSEAAGEPNRDLAVLRLQERLQHPAHGDLPGANHLLTTEAVG